MLGGRNLKVVQINSCYETGSTGKIAKGISKVLTKNNIENYIFYGTGHSDEKNAFRIGNDWYLKLNVLKTRLFGKHGFYSHVATLGMLKKLSCIKPDIIHLHNIHGHYVNVKMLFKYIKKHNIKTVWTLHDCWAFTGHCSHFAYAGCEKWKTACHNCSQLENYPKSLLFDRSKSSYNDKKSLFTGVGDLTIITPSVWLSNLSAQSFLKDYSIKVINNGIDLNAFKPCESDLKKRLNIEDKFILMGICSNLTDRKGGKYLIELAEKLPQDYVLIIVGLKDNAGLPENVITLPRTNSKKELAGIYSAADVFINPTLEDTFPTVNLEALACGTPVVTFDTGGSPESVTDGCGAVVEQGDVNALLKEVLKIKANKGNYFEPCVKKAKECYDETKKFEEYLKIYFGE